MQRMQIRVQHRLQRGCSAKAECGVHLGSRSGLSHARQRRQARQLCRLCQRRAHRRSQHRAAQRRRREGGGSGHDGKENDRAHGHLALEGNVGAVARCERQWGEVTEPR